MHIGKCIKESFVVIGREGSANDGEGFIQKFWRGADAHFSEAAHQAKVDADGNHAGLWGAMTDFSRSFKPWDGFASGLYMAGVECAGDARAPDGWSRRVAPGFEYIRVERTGSNTFPKTLQYLQDNGPSLAGAAHGFTCPGTGRS